MRDNLTKDEQLALRTLIQRTDIIIKQADKGSATVVMSREDYVSKAMDHLDNTDYYQKLGEDPTKMFSEEVEQFLKGMVDRCSIDKITMQSLLVKNAKHPGFTYYQRSTNPAALEDLLYQHVGP